MKVGLLRVTAALSVVLAMAAAGFLHRSPWIIALATPAFTTLYALGKWNAWTAAWRAGGARQIAYAILVTLPVQAVVAGVFYLIGLGLGALISAPTPIAALSGIDLLSAVALLVVGTLAGTMIIRLEGRGSAPAIATPAAAATAEEPEVDIDPTPLTPGTFFRSPGYWRVNASREAMEGRGSIVEKSPLAARDDMIVATEARLGVQLPPTLRNLYRVMNGGYVGWLFVPLKANPQPTYEDWRGAFSIDYSSLAPLEKLKTVAEHYDGFTHDPEDVPAEAGYRIILQARYGDMTLLDYAHGPQPRVLIVDYDKRVGDDPIDIVFEDFDTFFAALRRQRDRTANAGPRRQALRRPLREVPESERPQRFWGTAGPHAFYANAEARKNDFKPKLAADDVLISQTQARLGVALPASLIDLWRVKNGGSVSSRYVAATGGGAVKDREVMRYPVPLEYLVSLADLSDRISFPPGEIPWKERHAGGDKLVVLEADHGRVVLLDYRDPQGADPGVLLINDLDTDSLAEALHFGSFDDLLRRLCL